MLPQVPDAPTAVVTSPGGRVRPYGGRRRRPPVNPKGSAPNEVSGLDRQGSADAPPHPPAGRQRPPPQAATSSPAARTGRRERPCEPSGEAAGEPRVRGHRIIDDADHRRHPPCGRVQEVDGALRLAVRVDGVLGSRRQSRHPVAVEGGVIVASGSNRTVPRTRRPSSAMSSSWDERTSAVVPCVDEVGHRGEPIGRDLARCSPRN